jgi:hypothetical protein
MGEFHDHIDLKGSSLLIDGSAGEAGQFWISGGPNNPPSWYTLPTARVVRVDALTAGTIYVGTAPNGSSESANVWTIIRSQFTTAGIKTSEGTAANVTWTGRTGHTYT